MSLKGWTTPTAVLPMVQTDVQPSPRSLRSGGSLQSGGSGGSGGSDRGGRGGRGGRSGSLLSRGSRADATSVTTPLSQPTSRSRTRLALPSSAQLLRPSRRRLFPVWQEKLFVALDALQVYALLWLLSQAWPWPQIWLRWTRPAVWANLDFMSLTDRGAPMARSNRPHTNTYGETDHYPAYAFFFAAGFFAFTLPHLRASFLPRSTWLIFFSMATPVALAVGRLLPCNADGNHLTVDPEVVCHGWYHVGAMAVCFALFAASLLPLLRRYVAESRRLLVYACGMDHEKLLLTFEVSYMLDVSDEYMNLAVFNVSSFKRHAALFLGASLAQKLALVLIYIAFREDQRLQASLFWLCILAFDGYFLLRPPFRLRSSNTFYCACRLLLLLLATFGLMNGNEVQDSLLVASTQTIFMAAVTGAALLYLAVALLADRLWPARRSAEHATRKMLRCRDLRCHEAVDALRRARSTCARLLFAGERSVPSLQDVEALVRELWHCWRRARALESVLEEVLRDALDRLLFLHQRIAPRWDAIGTGRGFKGLEQDRLLRSNAAFRRRAERMALLPRRSRVLLAKVLALRAFIGHRQLARCHVLAPVGAEEPSESASTGEPSLRGGSSASGALADLQRRTMAVLEEPLGRQDAAEVSDMLLHWEGVVQRWAQDSEPRSAGPPAAPGAAARVEEWERIRAALGAILDVVRGASAGGPTIFDDGGAFVGLLEEDTVAATRGRRGPAGAEEARRLKKRWKALIRAWEAWFLETYGRPPARFEKLQRRRWYEHYRSLARLERAT